MLRLAIASRLPALTRLRRRCQPATHGRAAAGLVIAQACDRPTIAARLVARIDGCPSNTNNPIKHSSRRRASVRLLLPTIQPIHLRNKGWARPARSGLVAGIVAAPTGAINGGPRIAPDGPARSSPLVAQKSQTKPNPRRGLLLAQQHEHRLCASGAYVWGKRFARPTVTFETLS